MLLLRGSQELKGSFREGIVGVDADVHGVLVSILVGDGVGPNFQCSGPIFCTL